MRDPAGGSWWRDRRPTNLRDRVSPNIFRLQAACRRARIEILYSVIENLTGDGRDRSLDYRISGIDVAPGSRDAQVLDALAPAKDEMIFRKTSSNVFVSTKLDYVVRNLGTRSLMAGKRGAPRTRFELTLRRKSQSSRRPTARP